MVRSEWEIRENCEKCKTGVLYEDAEDHVWCSNPECEDSK